jgi:hypothetical protein
MTSVLSGISQVPRSASAFICFLAGSTTWGRFFSEAEFATQIALAATVSGTNVYFATNTLANTAMVAASPDVNGALAVGQTFKDLGKNYHIYTPLDSASGSIFGLWCVFTKVRRIGSPAGLDYEGDNGVVGYICTFSAAGTVANGVPSTTEPRVLVARTGFGHAF